MYGKIFDACLAFGGLGFWMYAMITMPDTVPTYVRAFATAFLWLIVGTVGLSRRD